VQLALLSVFIRLGQLNVLEDKKRGSRVIERYLSIHLAVALLELLQHQWQLLQLQASILGRQLSVNVAQRSVIKITAALGGCNHSRLVSSTLIQHRDRSIITALVKLLGRSSSAICHYLLISSSRELSSSGRSSRGRRRSSSGRRRSSDLAKRRHTVIDRTCATRLLERRRRRHSVSA